MRYRARIFESYATDSRRLVLIRDAEPGKIELATGFNWEKHDEGALFVSSAGIERSDEFVQVILNEAWEHGMRPSGFADAKNETTAIRAHLEDMRQIAFHKLGMKSS